VGLQTKKELKVQYNTKASNILFVNVSVKITPYSNEPVAIRIVADNFLGCASNKAMYYKELSLEEATRELLQAKIEQFRVQNNSNSVVVKIQRRVTKFLDKNVA
jgi:hypothetical protein